MSKRTPEYRYRPLLTSQERAARQRERRRLGVAAAFVTAVVIGGGTAAAVVAYPFADHKERTLEHHLERDVQLPTLSPTPTAEQPTPTDTNPISH